MTKRRRRFGKVRKLPSGRRQASYVATDGRRRTAEVTFPSRGDASTWLTLTEARIARGWTPTIHERVTVEQWAARWLASASPHLKRTTVVMYEQLLRLSILPTFGSRPLRDVRPIEVAEWIAELTKQGRSASWVRKSYRLLSQLMTAAVDNDLIPASPCRRQRLPRLAEPEPRILTRAEVDDLMACSKGQGRLIVQLLAFAGARIGEVLSLRRDDVSEDGRVLRVDERQIELKGHVDFDLPKAHQQRTVTVPDFVAAELLAHLAEHVGSDPRALVFTGRTGTPLRYGSWRRWTWVPAVKAAGLEDVTPHDLRATHGSWVARSHGIMAAARRLGHSNANVTTRHYAREVDNRDAEIAASFGPARANLGARGGHDEAVQDHLGGPGERA